MVDARGRGRRLVNVNVYLPLVAAVAVGAVGPTVARWLPPKMAARLLTLAALLVAGTSVSSLTLLAVTALVRVPDIATRGRLSLSVTTHAPVSLATGVLAAFTLLVLVPFAIRAAVSLCRELVRSYKLARAFSDHPSSIAVVQDPRPQAFAVPGFPPIPGRRPGIPPRIVTTDSLLRTLDPGQRRAMFAHEQAHLDRRHHLYLVATRVAAVVNPLLFRLPDAVTEATERWADEDAAATVGDRGVLATAIGRAALSAAAVPAPLPSMASAHVAARVRALLAPPPPRRPALSFAVGLALTATAVSAFDSAHEAEDFFDTARAAWHVAHGAPVHPSRLG